MQRQFPQALPYKLHAEAPIWGKGRTDSRSPCCVSNFSRTVPRTFFQETQPPDSQTRPASAFPRSSAATHHPNPGWRRRVLGLGERGGGEERNGQPKLRGALRGLDAGSQRRALGPRKKESGELEPCGLGPRGEKGRRRCRCTHSA